MGGASGLGALAKLQREQAGLLKALTAEDTVAKVTKQEARERAELERLMNGALHQQLRDGMLGLGHSARDTLTSSALDAIARTNGSVVGLAEPGALARIAREWSSTHEKYLEGIRYSGLTDRVDRAMLASAAHIATFAGVSGAAEVLFRNTAWENLATAEVLPAGAGVTLTERFLGVSEAYGALSGDLERNVLGLSPTVTALPAVEMYVGVSLARSISPAQADEAEDDDLDEALGFRAELEAETHASLEGAVGKLDPSLLVMWRGAKDALASKNPDRARHVTVSIRELYTQLLHRLAPDERVRAWTADPSLYDKGRPTRRARHLFIVRNVIDGPMKTFIDLDVRCALEFVDALQVGTHKVASGLSDEQLAVIILRMESVLRLMVEVDAMG